MGGGQNSNQQSAQFQWTNTLTNNLLPDWVNQEGKNNYYKVQGVANQAWDPNREQRVAGLTPQQLQAMGMQSRAVGNWSPELNQASWGTQGLLNFNPGNVTAGQLKNTNLQPYMDPYIQSVINATQTQADQQLGQQNTAAKLGAAGSGGFGGSREAITEGVNAAQTGMGMNTLRSQLFSQGYNNAQQAAIGDINRRFAADQGNQTAAQNAASFRLGAANQLGSLAAARQAMSSKDIQGMMASGLLGQQQRQNELNAGTNNANARYMDQVQKLNMLMASLGATPYNTSQHTAGMGGGISNSMGSQSSGSGLGLSLMGLLQAFGGMFSGGQNSAASGLGGGLSSLLGFMSEDSEKTDVKKVGQTDDGVGLFSYRYKGDPKNYPKVVGPMASEVEKKRPELVRRLGKNAPRVVNYGGLFAGA